MARHILILILALSPLVVSPVEALVVGPAELFLSGPLPSSAQLGALPLPHPGLHLLRSDQKGVILELTTPSYALTPDGAFHQLTVPGYGTSAEYGKPQVPLVSALLGVPADALVELRILEDETLPLPGRFLLRPAPHPAPLTEDLQTGRLLYEPDPDTYASDALYPPAPARIADDAWLRDQRLVRLELYPFQVNPAQGALTWHQRLQVEVRFAGRQGSTGAGEQRSGGAEVLGSRGVGERVNPFEAVLKQVLLNYDSARAWRGWPVVGDQLDHSKAAHPKSEIRNRKSEIAPRYKIVVDHDGLYRLTYADLQVAGMDVEAVDPQTFRLTSQGQDVAIYVAGEDDGRFDPTDFIAFYGQKFRGTILAERYAEEMAHWLTLCPQCQLAGVLEKYTDENVYWLTVGGAPGPRMEMTDGTPTDTAPVLTFYRTTIHAEESHEWYTHHFSSEDTWFWDRVQTGFDPITRTYAITLTALANGVFTATVRGEVVARTSKLHETSFFLNNQADPLYQSTWCGKTNHIFEVPIDQSVLNPGENQLHFVSDGDLDWVYFNWFEIEYARQFQAEDDQLLFSGNEGAWQYEIGNFLSATVEVYDVTDPLSPRRVLNPRVTAAGGTYTVAFEATHDAEARYFVVGVTAVQTPKRVLRYIPPDVTSTTGADYVVITHQDFITATQMLADYRASQGLSTMVVDVADLYNEFNDGIFHPIAIKNFLAYAFATWETHPAYVLLVGDGHWNLKGYSGYDAPPIYMPPNLAFVDPWQGEVDSANLLAAVVGDDILPDLHIGRLPVNSVEELNAVINKIIAYEQAGSQDWHHHLLFVADNVPDSAGDFVAVSEGIIANYLPPGYKAHRIYLNDYCGPPTSPPQLCPAVNAAIVEALNGTGALLVNYIGHGSVERWAEEQILTNDDIASLSNGERLPLIVSMTCLDGYFIYPDRPCLAEENLRAEGRGAVSTWSPTGLGSTTSQQVLQRGFYTAIFRDGVRQLGPATLAAKLELYATGWDYDLIHTFTIFGDPALQMQGLPSRIYLPLIQKR